MRHQSSAVITRVQDNGQMQQQKRRKKYFKGSISHYPILLKGFSSFALNNAKSLRTISFVPYPHIGQKIFYFFFWRRKSSLLLSCLPEEKKSEKPKRPKVPATSPPPLLPFSQISIGSKKLLLQVSETNNTKIW